MQDPKHVVESAEVYSLVTDIIEEEAEDVYCLNVPTHGNFLVNEGIVVKNCLDAVRYALFTHLFGKEGQRLSPKDIDSLYHETRGTPNANLPRFFQDDDLGRH